MLHFLFLKKVFCFFQNADVFSGGLNWSTRPSILRACTNVDLVGKRCDDGVEAAPSFHDDPRTQDSAVEDFVTPATDENIHVQTERMQTGVCLNSLFKADVSLILL